MGKQSSKNSYDVIVVGGGLAGLTMTALLAADGAHVLCLDREAPAAQLNAAFDGRTTAISYGSRKVLAAAGLWDALTPDACAIDTIQILDGESPVLLTFGREEAGGRSFGWIVENNLLRRALFGGVQNFKKAAHIAPAAVAGFAREDGCATAILEDGRRFSASLVIGADGRNSFTREWMDIGAREWRYRQRAVVCVAAHENPHENIAVEHFRPEGPFAILPMTDGPDGGRRSSVVWTEHGPDRNSALHYDQESFDAALAARFPARYGAVRQTGRRFSYPLGLVHAHQYIAPRMALIAEAAHGIHPIAGQGLNMGFRDIAALAALVREALNAGRDPGADVVLQAYQRQRRFDNMAMAGATDTLNRLFSNDVAPARILRRAGLQAVSRLPFAKQFFMKQAMGAAGLLPSLIRDENLREDRAA
jgi:2-octaprenyl-6-methoxyphenol hydroxylase